MNFKVFTHPIFLALFVLTIFNCPDKVKAQDNKIVQRISFWGGYSTTSVRFLGKTRDAKSQIIAFGYQRKLMEYKPDYYLWLTADIIPYLHYDYSKRDESGRPAERSGAGISPIGFKMVNTISNLWNPFVSTSGGIIYMNKKFPTDKARQLNFTFDINIGNTIHLNNNSFLSLGYKFHHISNAQTGKENPGLDSNFFFLKISIQ
ncbi:acyloxyacyl hydrolase [Gracilimonas sp.]|uniref:acyloxyacyl hydrolase n=1 Tax=Gracilimonas sp. TaxID=1974203 RepID=UPI0028724117|nr:acyloxyacyl hydrolase [Gracilimonas sp.]